MKLGVKRASMDLKKQLEAFWTGEAPFGKLEPERLKGITPLQYWKRYEIDPHARVLAVCPTTLDGDFDWLISMVDDSNQDICSTSKLYA